jgi:hypothetical protein
MGAGGGKMGWGGGAVLNFGGRKVEPSLTFSSQIHLFHFPPAPVLAVFIPAYLSLGD